jgi:two-component system chemotaxis sensor kinase CheA
MDSTWLHELPAKALRGLYAELADGGQQVWLLTYTPAPEAFARGQDPLRLVRGLPGIRWFDLDAHSVIPDAPDSGPSACRLIVRMVLAANDPTVSEGLASEGERINLSPVTLYDLCLPTGESQSEGRLEDWQELVSQARELLKQKQGLALWRLLAARLNEGADGTWQASVLRWMKCVLETARPDQALLEALLAALASGRFDARTVAPTAPRSPSALAASQTDPSDLRVHATLLIQAQISLLGPAPPDALLSGRMHAAATACGRLFRAVGETGLASKVAEALDAALQANAAAPLLSLAEEALRRWQVVPAQSPSLPSGTEPGRPPAAAVPSTSRNEDAERHALRLLKVEPSRIDALLGLVGELVVAKNALPFLARRAEEEFGSRQLAREIKERYSAVNRIAEELQGAVMRVRMVPLGQVFRRFPRLVRDLSAKLGKSIQLQILGEETEADKSIVEELFDPLVHLFRNSIDHGIELPDDREAAGKPRDGLISLSARHAEDNVIIELQDDGHGIDVERVRKKAAEKNLASPEDLRQRSEDEIIQLIFAPGFSTVDNVSELSGRGVGMDAVRTMVSRAGGTIAISSKVGRGTTTRITLPVTMAVSRVMILESGGIDVGMPFSNITETARVQVGDIKHIGEGMAVVLRGRLVAVWNLAEVLGLTKTAAQSDGGVAVVVLRVDGQEFGLLVDAFQETVDIIAKPLPGVIGKLELFSGTALLGDGRVLLVLDPKEVVRCL